MRAANFRDKNHKQDEGRDPVLFFVGGQGKSGTTWVQLLLDAHPQISCAGEAHFFDLLAPALQQAFARYRRQLENNNRSFPELAGYPLPQQAQAMAALRAAVQAAIRSQLGDMPVTAYGERTPANVEHLDLIWSLFPKARFIHVVRDPRDAAVSLWHHGLRLEGDAFVTRFGTLEALAEQLAAGWADWMQRSATLCAERPLQYLEVRYEDLLEDGLGTLARLLRFLEVAVHHGESEACLQAAGFERLSGGRKRGEEDSGSHFRKGISGDWRHHLGRDSVRRISQRADHQLRRLGYPTD